MSQQAKVVIIGGGIWGLSTAYHLARYGAKKICVLERSRRLASETTRQAAGQVGQIRTRPTVARAIRYTLQLLGRFAEETGHDPAFHQSGSLMLALVPERMAAYQRQVQWAQQHQIKAEFVSHAQMKCLVPALDTAKIEGAFFVPEDGYVDAQRCALAYAAAARDLGVEIQLETPVVGLDVCNGKIAGVQTTHGFIPAEHVVITAGPWVTILSRMVGFAPPMQPIRLQQAHTVSLPDVPPHHPVVRVPDESCYLRPDNGGYLYGFFEPEPTSIDLEARSADFTTSNIEPPLQVIAEARRRLAPIFPILKDAVIDHYQQGMLTITPDGSYLLGPVPGVADLLLASGCNGMGISGSGGVGRWLAKWILEGNPGENLSEYAPDRFGEKAANRDWVRREGERVFTNYYRLVPEN